MFNDQRDRRDSIIATVMVVIACAGVFWMRSEPPKAAIPVGGAAANENVATFKLTEPLPQAHDGAREVIGDVYECVIDGERTFSNRRCAAAAK